MPKSSDSNLYFKFLQVINLILKSLTDDVLKILFSESTLVDLTISSSKDKTLCKLIILAFVFFNLERLNCKMSKLSISSVS